MNLILVGGGGHCKSVIDVAECVGYTILGILDRPEEVSKRVLDYEVIGEDADMAKYADKAEFRVTVGQIVSKPENQTPPDAGRGWLQVGDHCFTFSPRAKIRYKKRRY